MATQFDQLKTGMKILWRGKPFTITKVNKESLFISFTNGRLNFRLCNNQIEMKQIEIVS